MPIRRVGRPGLLGLAARTAVVAGTATAVSGGMQRHQQQRAQDEYEQQQFEAHQQQAQLQAAAQQAVAQQQAGAAPGPVAAAPGTPAAPAGAVDIVAELQKLAALQQQGLLSADEFAAAKAKLLG
ncbi:SHOCT domain-containing protein [Agromyces larvae]|uniref:SHOCT domain-containing protein n=1 Tax=Agromyces larvae TaxID=2929802 RepID=A0ABY4BWF7_9MICO|nr:SHOCT domain-containing protein [Agromyces larvae]UOE43239.1 SHOCT domain-containing protein [Agromyces larvae]